MPTCGSWGSTPSRWRGCSPTWPGSASVSAVEPSASFAAAVRERLPGVEVRQSAAEQLPFPDGAFDAALAQLVVHFMADPVRGLREMRRVTRPGGTVAACVWDHAGGRGPLAAFWSGVRELDPAADDESALAGVREGHLASLFTQAGLDRAQASTLTVRVRHASFDHWWQPFTLGVGPAAGAYCPPAPWRSPPPPGRSAACAAKPGCRLRHKDVQANRAIPQTRCTGRHRRGG